MHLPLPLPLPLPLHLPLPLPLPDHFSRYYKIHYFSEDSFSFCFFFVSDVQGGGDVFIMQKRSALQSRDNCLSYGPNSMRRHSAKK